MHFIFPVGRKESHNFPSCILFYFVFYMCFYTLFSHTQIILRAQGIPKPCRELSNDSPKYEKAVNFNPASKG